MNTHLQRHNPYTPYNLMKWAVIITLCYFAFLHFMPAFAVENPLKGVKVVTGKENDVGGTISWSVKLFGTAVMSIAILWAMSSLLFTLVTSLKDSLRDKAWGEFFLFLVILCIAMAFVVFLGNIGFTVLLKLKDIITDIMK